MKAGFINIIVIIFITGCLQNSQSTKPVDEEEMLKHITKEYIQVKTSLDRKLVNHFPQKLDSNYITFTNSASLLSPPIGLKLIKKYKDTSEWKKLFNIAIAKYSAKDTCLLVVNRFANKDNYSTNIKLSRKDSIIINRDCYNMRYPIPNFWHNKFTTKSTAYRLPADFEMIVIDAKPGIYFNQEDFEEDRISQFMPDQWKHGYSRGIAISKVRRVIIYWVIIW